MTARIIKRTEITGNLTVVTRKQMDPHLLRPFETLVFDNSEYDAVSTSSFTCKATALEAHDALVRRIGGSHDR